MKGLILSGGKGTRLRPLTHTAAKQLVPVANKPILFYGIEALRKAGITEVGIVVGDTWKEIQDTLGDGSAFDIKISYIRQEEPLGLAHAVLTARPYLGNDRFVMFLGDNLIKNGIASQVQAFRDESPNSQILLARVPRPQEFGVAEIEGGKVVRLTEKPQDPKSDLALVGVYMFDENIFRAAENIKPSWRNELEITDAIQWLIDAGLDVRWREIDGWWKDTGKLDDMLEANRIILGDLERNIGGEVDAESRLDGPVVVGKGARVVKSMLRGPCIIGENCLIEESYVGPFTSIYYEVEIVRSEIEHSIVLERSVIRDSGARIESSLLGKDVRIERAPGVPRAMRFMVGDSSRIEIL